LSFDDLHEIWQFEAARTSKIEVFGDGKWLPVVASMRTEMETEGDDGQ
jgi:hypothetical protein